MINRERVRRVARGRAVRWAAVVVLALVGAGLAIRLFASVDAAVGPVDTRLSVGTSVSGGTRVEVPPLGALRLRDHAGPFRLDVRTVQLREADARRLLKDPRSVAELPQRAADDVRQGVLALVLRGVAVSVLGAMLLVGLAFRRLRTAVVAGGVALATAAASVGIAWATFDARALEEPEYSGLLADAPGLVGDARTIVADFDRYSRQLARLTENVARLYDATSSLPTYTPDPQTIRVLHVSDIHDNPGAFDLIRSLVEQFHIDAVVDSGDLTDFGSAAEDWVAAETGRVGAPYVYVRGNHDSARTQAAVARQKDAVVLDGNLAVVAGLRMFGAGDPRFTPDKRRYENRDEERGALREFGLQTRDLALFNGPLDIAVVHDPTAATELLGTASVVLSGHLHHRESTVEEGSVLLVQGSTGGAGLRALEGEEPTPLTCTILYFDRASHRFQAYDEVTVGGLGESSVQITRRLAPAAR